MIVKVISVAENLCFESTDAGSDDTGAGVECLFAEEGTVRDGRLVGTSFRMIIALLVPALSYLSYQSPLLLQQ